MFPEYTDFTRVTHTRAVIITPRAEKDIRLIKTPNDKTILNDTPYPFL